MRLIHIRRLVQESTGNSRNKVRSLRPVGSKQGQVAIDFYSRWWRAARQLAGLGGGTARGAVPPAALPDVMPAACRAAGRLTVRYAKTNSGQAQKGGKSSVEPGSTDESENRPLAGQLVIHEIDLHSIGPPLALSRTRKSSLTAAITADHWRPPNNTYATAAPVTTQCAARPAPATVSAASAATATHRSSRRLHRLRRLLRLHHRCRCHHRCRPKLRTVARE